MKKTKTKDSVKEKARKSVIKKEAAKEKPKKRVTILEKLARAENNLKKGHKGNNYGAKYKTKKERIEACDRLCEHLKSGLSLDCFEVDRNTIYKYIKDFPSEFTSKAIKSALLEGRKFWEEEGVKGMKGERVTIREESEDGRRTVIREKGFNATAWIFNMKNRFGWADRVENVPDALTKEEEELKMQKELDKVFDIEGM